MKRSRRQRCAVYGSPGAQRFACMSPQELDAARRRGLAYDATPGVEYESEEECAERCNALLALPVPSREEITSFLPYPELQRFKEAFPSAGPGMSQAVLQSEERACDALPDVRLPFVPWPHQDIDYVRLACRKWRLPCARPCAELLERLRRPPLRLAARPGQPFVSVAQGPPIGRGYTGSTVLTIADAAAAARAFPDNPRYLAGRDWTRARRFPGAQTLPVLLPGESVLLAGVPGGEVQWGMLPFINSFRLTSNLATNAPRLSFRLQELVPEAEELAERTVEVWYDVPLPEGVDPEALLGTYGEQPLLEAAGAMADAVSAMLGLPVSPGLFPKRRGGTGVTYRAHEPQSPSAAVIEMGMPVQGVTVTDHVPTVRRTAV